MKNIAQHLTSELDFGQSLIPGVADPSVLWCAISMSQDALNIKKAHWLLAVLQIRTVGKEHTHNFLIAHFKIKHDFFTK